MGWLTPDFLATGIWAGLPLTFWYLDPGLAGFLLSGIWNLGWLALDFVGCGTWAGAWKNDLRNFARWENAENMLQKRFPEFRASTQGRNCVVQASSGTLGCRNCFLGRSREIPQIISSLKVFDKSAPKHEKVQCGINYGRLQVACEALCLLEFT